MTTLILAIALTAFLVEVARRLAPAIGLVDAPDQRKAHKGEIPLVGGIGIYAALLIVTAYTGLIAEHWPFIVSGTLLVLIGMLDDVFGMSPVTRLLLQTASVLFLCIAGNVYLSDLGGIIPGTSEFELGIMSIPFTVFAGVGIINAFNMSDGVDGLCGTLTLFALFGFGIVAYIAGMQSELLMVGILGGALIGFLMFNLRLPGRQQAAVFLGDAGSYLLGLSVLYFAMKLSQGEPRAMTPVSALWFCMLPLFDTGGMILRRIRRGRSPFSPDREHIHHVFLLAKFSVSQTLIVLAVVSLSGVAIGVTGLLLGVPESIMLAGFVAGATMYYLMIMRAWRVMKFLRRSINRREEVVTDRRSGKDRRQSTSIAYVNGVPVERRSGEDRRDANSDRRGNNEEEQQSAKVTVLVKRSESKRPGSRAARTTSS
jgi:UDP-GlcNAc:undecaprenyl-phosphate GlcNAc-1-phosphate transferase